MPRSAMFGSHRDAKRRPCVRAHRLIPVIAVLLTLFLPGVAGAHDLNITDVRLTIDNDRGFVLYLACHPDAVYAGLSPLASVTDEAYARLDAQPEPWHAERRGYLIDYFRRKAEVLVGDEPVVCEVAFPQEGRPETASIRDGRRFGQIVTLSGRLPDDAASVRVRLADSLAPASLLIVPANGGEPYHQLLNRGGASEPYPLGASNGAPITQPPPAPPRQSIGVVVRDYLILGFEHILPKGLDHILFVLGLFLLSEKLAALLWQVTAFTAAHTITLALATTGVVSLPASIVEPLIALSIAYVGIENLCTKKLMPWRPAVVFVFGLLHGLGFAGVLSGLGLPEGRMIPALVSFNIGVEIGQIAVIAGALLLVGWFRKKKWYRPAVVIPGSGAIALMGLYWAVTRALGV